MKRLNLFLVLFIALASVEPVFAQSVSSTTTEESTGTGTIDWKRILGETAHGGNRSVMIPLDGLAQLGCIELSAQSDWEDITVEIVSSGGETIYCGIHCFSAFIPQYISVPSLASGQYEIYITHPSGLYQYGTFRL